MDINLCKVISKIFNVNKNNILTIQEEGDNYKIEIKNNDNIDNKIIDKLTINNFINEINQFKKLTKSINTVNMFIHDNITLTNNKTKKNEFRPDILKFINMCNIIDIVPTIYLHYDSLSIIRSLESDIDVSYEVLLDLNDIKKLDTEIFVFSGNDLNEINELIIKKTNIYFVLSLLCYNTYLLNDGFTTEQESILKLLNDNGSNLLYDDRFEQLNEYFSTVHNNINKISYNILTSIDELFELINVKNICELTTQGILFVYDEDLIDRTKKLLDLIAPIAIHITVINKSKDDSTIKELLDNNFISSYTIVSCNDYINQVSLLLFKYIFMFHRIFIDISNLKDSYSIYMANQFDNIKIIYDNDVDLETEYERIDSSSEDIIEEIAKIIEIYGDVYDKKTINMEEYESECEEFKKRFKNVISNLNDKGV